jgi:hypothetical protein
MAEPALSHKVLLIDLENCPSQIKQLLSNMEVFSQVVICYANGNPKIPLDWLVPLASAVNAEKLRIVRMDNGGKNAADFGICFFAGMLMQSLPPDTHFVIVSNDAGLDHAVSLLISQGRTAERVGKVAESSGGREETTQGNEISSPLGIYCTHLVTHSKTRPAKEATLRSSIKAKFGGDEKIAEDIFKLLLDSSAISIESGGIIYDDKKILVLAAHSNG